MKHYLPYERHALQWGLSRDTVRNLIDVGLKLMDQLYAKPRLIHGSNAGQQYWTRERIKENTPSFVYRLRHVEPNMDKLIITCDGTYQYCHTIQTSHSIRKKTTSGAKKSRNLIKVHIFLCTNGQPLHAFITYSDGNHSDGKIFECCLSPEFVMEEQEKLRNGQNANCFVDEETCEELLNLQKLIQVQDDCICDNGYQLKDPRLKAPREAPQNEDEGGRVTTLAAAWRRAITAIRQTQERFHRWIKRMKFCDSIICVEDIKRVAAVWRICLADAIYGK